MKYYYLENNDKSYKKVYGEIAGSILIEKKSKFYSYIFNITSENEAINYINELKIQNKEARHVVYIYSVLIDGKLTIRFSDDGEPRGTGTKAIYEFLTKENITNVCIVIIRYFGGILLGAGPLLRVYFNVAKTAIDLCDKKEVLNYIPYNFNTTYSKFTQIKPIIDKYASLQDVIINAINYNEDVYVDIQIKEEKYNEVLEKIKQII